MAEPCLCSLLAISTDVLPELRAAKERYYTFWNGIGAVAVIGWVLVLSLYRWRKPRPALVALLVGVSLVAGSMLGYLVWRQLAEHSWGDIGVGSRWLGELTACVLGCVGWLLVCGWLLCHPRRGVHNSPIGVTHTRTQ